MSGGPPTPRRLLVLVDDGWRYERQELLQSMKAAGVPFDVATHDAATYDCLKDDYHIIRLKLFLLRRNPFYALVMLFARELDTNIVRAMNELRRRTGSRWRRFLLHARRGVRFLGLQRYSYPQALRFMYRRSKKYADVLKDYGALMFNPVNSIDKRIVHEAARAGLKRFCFVYSWDNPMKDNEFPPDADAYFVWNEPCRQEIRKLHGVPEERIHLTGPTQFEFILRRKPMPVPKDPAGRYVLFACSVGWYPFLIDQELRLIRLTQKLLEAVAPGVRLVVRPYPFAGIEDPYVALRYEPGIEVADFGTFIDWRLDIGPDELEDRMRQIERAECMINIGSTIALEASYTSTPILQIAFSPPNGYEPWQDIQRVMENDHLRYMNHPDCPNVVRSEDQLRNALADILGGRAEPYLRYSRLIQEFARPMPVPSYHELFIGKLTAQLG